MKHTTVYILVLLCCTVIANAQLISVPFSNSFEATEDNTPWVLNDGTADALDQWVIGGAQHSDGQQSLYITNNGGAIASYGASPNTVWAYRKIQFPVDPTEAIQHYDLSFDWKNSGSVNQSELYVFFDTEQNFLNLMKSSSTSGTVLNSAAMNSMLRLGQGGSTRALYGMNTWQNVSYQINMNQNNAQNFTFVLAFVWVNKNVDNSVIENLPTGACIDNIQLCFSKAVRPSNLNVELNCGDEDEEKSGAIISWNSVLEDFILEFRETNSNKWSRITGLVANDWRDPNDGTKYTFEIDQMNEGLYEFRICGILGSDTSAYAYFRDFRLFCWSNHCINYINFYGDNVECRVGAFRNPDTEIRVVDYGEYEQESRHTVCAHKGEFDPYTVDASGKHGLLKVPDDCVASVRLGNWKAGGEEESITYTLTVDSTENAILLVRYAIVFQRPTHDDEVNEFKLEILDENGYLIDKSCGEAHFRYSPEDVGEWNDWAYANTDGKWKDWTTIGLNLSAYHGHDIKIRFSTYDCGWSGHFSYAYFVIDCANARLETETCGDIPMINVQAPDGFDYTWTNESGEVVSHDKTIEVGRGDRQRYTCNVCYKEAADCCFELSTALAPRYPFASYNVSYEPSRCRNTIRFNNTSHVIMINDTETEHLYKEGCESYLWEIRSLRYPNSAPMSVSLPNPTYNCNVAGDQIEVKLIAYLAEETCEDVRIDTINVPSILTEEMTQKMTFCEGNAILFAGEYRTETGIYLNPLKNVAGCDSLIYLDLTVNPNSPEQFISDTICSDGVYHLDSLVYNQTGNYEVWLRNLWGCDSIVNLNLLVLERLSVDVEQLPTICADGERLTINFDVFDGQFDSVAVRIIGGDGAFNDVILYDWDAVVSQTIQIPYPSDIKPDHYVAQVEFYQHQACGNQIFELPFDINYSSSIIVQKWNDVLALRDSVHNGGYNFVGFQWYRGDTPIEGATGPYLYLGDEEFDWELPYYVALTRDDGVTINTCYIYPQRHTDKTQFPSIVNTLQRVKLPITQDAYLTIYDTMGRVYSTSMLDKNHAEFIAPAMNGIYIVNIIYSDSNIEKFKMIVF